MGSNREKSNIAIAILKITIMIEYQKLFRILGAPIIFSTTVCETKLLKIVIVRPQVIFKIIMFNIYYFSFTTFSPRERDYYSKNISILNISSFTVIETCFEVLKSSEHEIL